MDCDQQHRSFPKTQQIVTVKSFSGWKGPSTFVFIFFKAGKKITLIILIDLALFGNNILLKPIIVDSRYFSAYIIGCGFSFNFFKYRT